MKKQLWIGLVLAAVTWSGCHTVYEVNRTKPESLIKEGTIVFVRPDKYSVFGTRSFRDYIEITHERAAQNDAGLLQVQVGFRNRGGKHWWDTEGPDFVLSVKTVYYDQPGGSANPPLYETNWQTMTLNRGSTFEYKSICPKKSGLYYQVVVSELVSSR